MVELDTALKLKMHEFILEYKSLLSKMLINIPMMIKAVMKKI